MTVGILGLGLIGGSMARAYAKAGHTVLAAEKDSDILTLATLSGAVHGILDETTIGSCELILLAIYPGGSVAWLEQNATLVDRKALVMDCCGIKREVCSRCFPLAEQYGFTFIGGHPMAGSHHSGYKYSRSNLFQGAPMVLVPPRFDDASLLERATNALAPCGFGSFSVTTAEEHDRIIAFTSQIPHIVSNAYIKSPNAQNHKGFSAGSYKDMTRVAWLNPRIELDTYLQNLTAYRDALEQRDTEALTRLLEDGKRRKEEVDG